MNNVLIIADTHIPFVHRNYLEFCKQIQKRVKCKTVVHSGDLCDLNACSYHEHHPDGYSPADEMAKADKVLQKWFKAFPKLSLCRGNHDQLISRKGKTAGLPSRCFRSFKEMWGLPKGWNDAFEWEVDGVLYTHGLGYSGKQPHMTAAVYHRQSTVIGHAHSRAGVAWTASSKDILFGMAVGCGFNRKAYAFNYGKDFKEKPILGCGVVTDNGRHAQFMPMGL